MLLASPYALTPTTIPTTLQMQLADHGEHALEVEAWLEEHFGYLPIRVGGTPGLTIAVTLPDHLGELETPATWHARLNAMAEVRDLGFEIIFACLEALGLRPCDILSAHLTSD